MDPAFIFTPHYGHGFFLLRQSWQVSPFPIMLWTNASSNISDLIYPEWKVIVFNFVNFSTNPIRQNIPMRRLVIPVATPVTMISGDHHLHKTPPRYIPLSVPVCPGRLPCPPPSEIANGKPHYQPPHLIVLDTRPPPVLY